MSSLVGLFAEFGVPVASSMLLWLTYALRESARTCLHDRELGPRDLITVLSVVTISVLALAEPVLYHPAIVAVFAVIAGTAFFGKSSSHGQQDGPMLARPWQTRVCHIGLALLGASATIGMLSMSMHGVIAMSYHRTPGISVLLWGVRLEPQNFAIRAELARALIASGRCAEARTHVAVAHQLWPQATALSEQLARCGE
jgi:hypothetical protein